MNSKILTLDAQGQPSRWISHEAAITYHAKNLVAWQLGEGQGDVIFRGGENRVTGLLTTITTAPIIAVKGRATAAKRMHKAPPLTNRELFNRDRHLCAYCGKTFSDIKLTREHVIPRSRGGLDIWENVVCACESCNHKKDNQLLEECGMKLLYVPYVPNRAEALILASRNILACQMAYLLSFVSKSSRAHDEISQRMASH